MSEGSSVNSVRVVATAASILVWFLRLLFLRPIEVMTTASTAIATRFRLKMRDFKSVLARLRLDEEVIISSLYEAGLSARVQASRQMARFPHIFWTKWQRSRYMVWCEPARGAARIRASVWLVTPSNRINGQADTKVTVTAQNVNEDECLFNEPLQWYL